MGYTVKDKVILVTGGNRGIGKAYVEAFLEKGASKVYVGVRDLSKFDEAFLQHSYDARTTQPKLIPLLLDLNQPKTINEAAKHVTDVDILINNAGIISHTNPLDENVIDQLQEEMNINVYGFLYIVKEFASTLEKRNGILIQMNSVASLRCGVSSVATYSASKAASYSLTQAIRQQLAGKVHVVSVHPGPIATDMISSALPEFKQIAEPPINVANMVIQCLEHDEADNEKPNPPFLIFPDEKAKQLGVVYESFAKKVIIDGHNYG